MFVPISLYEQDSAEAESVRSSDLEIGKLFEFGRAPKARQLLLIQLAPVADRDLLVHDRPDAHAAEAGEGVADRVEHPAHLPLPSFVQHDLDEGLLGA